MEPNFDGNDILISPVIKRRVLFATCAITIYGCIMVSSMNQNCFYFSAKSWLGHVAVLFSYKFERNSPHLVHHSLTHSHFNDAYKNHRLDRCPIIPESLDFSHSDLWTIAEAAAYLTCFSFLLSILSRLPHAASRASSFDYGRQRRASGVAPIDIPQHE